MPSLYDNSVDYDIPYNVGLEDTLTNIKLNKNVQQRGTVYESGGLNNWLVAGAANICSGFLDWSHFESDKWVVSLRKSMDGDGPERKLDQHSTLRRNKCDRLGKFYLE